MKMRETGYTDDQYINVARDFLRRQQALEARYEPEIARLKALLGEPVQTGKPGHGWKARRKSEQELRELEDEYYAATSAVSRAAWEWESGNRLMYSPSDIRISGRAEEIRSAHRERADRAFQAATVEYYQIAPSVRPSDPIAIAAQLAAAAREIEPLEPIMGVDN